MQLEDLRCEMKNQWHAESPGDREQETEEARSKGKIKQLTQKVK
jgi:hypothetical protein